MSTIELNKGASAMARGVHSEYAALLPTKGEDGAAEEVERKYRYLPKSLVMYATGRADESHLKELVRLGYTTYPDGKYLLD